MRTSLVSAAIAFIAGILLGRAFLLFPVTAAGMLFVLLVAGSLALFLRHFRRGYILVAVLAVVAGTASFVVTSAFFPSDHVRRLPVLDGRSASITGRIVSPLDRDEGRTAFTLSLMSIDGAPASGRMRVSVRDERLAAGYGDTVLIAGKLRGPRSFRNPGGFDYAEHLAGQGIFAVANARSSEDVHVLRSSRGIFRTVLDWREQIRRSVLASLSGPGSAVLQAMVLGEEGGLTDTIRERFMTAGVTHILSISGSHIGFVALLCFGAVRWLLFLLPERRYLRLTLHADPKKIAALCALPPVVFYAMLAGGQVATLRSTIMALTGLAALLLDRRNMLMHSLAAAALALLIIDPRALFDISFQLSFLSVVAIGFIVSLWNELVPAAEGRLRRIAVAALLLFVVSLVTFAATGPLTAFYFNQISPVGILANLIVIPFAGVVVVPLGLASGVASLFLGRFPLPGLNQAVNDAFYGIVSFFARFPFAEWHPRSPGLLGLAAFGVLFVSGAIAAREFLRARFKPLEHTRRVPRIAVYGMVLAGAFLVVSTMMLFLPKHEARITFLDVGQGDCSLIELPSGKTVLIDGGGTIDNRFDIGRRVVAPFLWDRGIKRLDLVILSHPHPDHLNGLLFVLEHFHVAEAWASGLDADLPAYDAFAKIVTERKIPLRIVSAADPPVSFGGTELSVLHPDPGFKSKSRKAYDAENNRSLVIRMASAGRTALFTGDIGTEVEKGLVERGADISCDVIKVPHHGSKTSSSEDFLARARPSLAVASAGQGNLFHHPSPEVVERYEQNGARFCRTDRDGAVIVLIGKDGTYRVVPWAEMLLEKISLDSREGWGAVEKRNWKRLWERMGM